MTTGELLKSVRQRTGMTQRAFAEYFSIPLRTYEQWERGLRKMPNYLFKLIIYKVHMEKLAEDVTDDLATKIRKMENDTTI